MSHWETLSGLPLEVAGYSLEALRAQVSSAFERTTTVVHLQGGGEEGLGEDVTYDGADHELLVERFQGSLAPEPGESPLPLDGSFTLGSFCEHVESLDLFPEE
ncbi:MAG: hypothetical protein KGJ43_08325, partial [Acidobacteriota bacterium]|nr:hypothetical protein [Acidobacteriota bacterium]